MLAVALLAAALPPARGALFFSEYVEGSGTGHKALELFNPTGTTVNLAEYQLRFAVNGGDWGRDTTLEGTLCPRCVHVLSHADCGCVQDAELPFPFNGNDAIGLFDVATDALVDVIGVPGAGKEFGVAGVPGATADHTLVRKADVLEGTADWAASAGTSAENSQWEVRDKDDLSDLGRHLWTGVAVDDVPHLTRSAALYYHNVTGAVNGTAEVTPTHDELQLFITDTHHRPVVAPQEAVSFLEVIDSETVPTGPNPNDTVTLVRLFFGNALVSAVDGRVHTSAGEPTADFIPWEPGRLWPSDRGLPADEPATWDLHHVFPVSSAVHALRADKYFADPVPSDPSYRKPAHPDAPDCAVTDAIWQPAVDQRGDVARAVFYVAFRYNLLLVDFPPTAREPQMGLASQLLRWHEIDAPDDAERRRNDRVQQTQGNRNPWVDFPAWMRQFVASHIVPVPAPPVLDSPPHDVVWTQGPSIPLDYTLPEPAVPGSVRLTISVAPTSTLNDPGAPHILVFADTPELLAAGQHTGTLVATDLGSTTGVATMPPGAHLLIEGVVYELELAYEPEGPTAMPVVATTNSAFRYGTGAAATPDPGPGTPPADVHEYYREVADKFLDPDFPRLLHDLVLADHVAASSYTDTRELLEFTDEDMQDPSRVRLIYSDHSALKEAFSNAAFDVSDQWNREHSWPRSRGVGESGRDNVDLHHLFPSVSRVNSARGNRYFDDVQPFDAGYGRPGHELAAPDSERSTVAWEPPAATKGDIARAVFYMALRYDGEFSNESDLHLTVDAPEDGSPQMGPADIYFLWHEQDLPDAFEVRRNDRIHALQGNRNPFVDHPEWARYALARVGHQPPTLHAPRPGGGGGIEIEFDFELPTAAESGSVRLVFGHQPDDPFHDDPDAPHVVVLDSSFTTAGRHSGVVVGSSLVDSPGMSQVLSPTGQLLDGSVYRFEVSYVATDGRPGYALSNRVLFGEARAEPYPTETPAATMPGPSNDDGDGDDTERTSGLTDPPTAHAISVVLIFVLVALAVLVVVVVVWYRRGGPNEVRRYARQLGL